MIYVIIALGRTTKFNTCAIRFVRVHIAMKHWKRSWKKIKISLMMMRNN